MNRRAFGFGLIATATYVGSATAATIPSPQSGKGLIMLFRPRRAMGAAIRFQVTTAHAPVGNLSNGSVIAFQAPPDQHIFTVSTPSVTGSDAITVDIKAGETAYIRADMRAGWPAGRGKFLRMHADQARAENAKI